MSLKPPKPPEPPKIEDPEVGRVRARSRLAVLAARGRSSTILTGPAGATGPAPVGTAKLLGG